MVRAYHAVYFEDVGSAVAFCHDLVPHVSPKNAELFADDERPVVWFHVPPRGTETSRDGCYLLLSAGAVQLAQDAGLDVPVSGVIPRMALPTEAVLVFGEDRAERRETVSRRRAPRVVVRRSPVLQRSAEESSLIPTLS